MDNAEWKSFITAIINVLLVFFIVYFILFLLLDFMAVGNAIQYNILAPSIYSSSTAYLIISGILFFISLYFLYADRGFRIFLAGIIFIASPLRAILMINLNPWFLTIIYDIAIIVVTSFLIYKIAKNENISARRAAFVSLFLLYMFLISLAVVIRDFFVYSGSLPPISFGSYLHYGIYDYLTAFFAITLGMMAVKYYAKEFSSYRKMRENMRRIEEYVRMERFTEAVKLCEEIMPEGEGKYAKKLRILYAYSLHRLGENDKAARVIEDVDDAYGLKGDIYSELGEYEKAMENYRRAVREDSKDYASWINLGKIYADKGDMENAEKCFRMGMEINRKNIAAWQNLSALALVKGRYNDALKILAEAEKYVGKK